jgi:hypothetical protein
LPSLLFPCQFTLLAQSYLEEQQEHGCAKPEGDQRDCEHFAGQPIDQGGANRPGDDERRGRSKGQDTRAGRHRPKVSLRLPAERDTERMKLHATIVISYRADSFGDAGDALDDVLQRARERDDVEIDSIQLGTPASAGPVSIPYVERPPAPPQRVPHPLPNGEHN